MSETALAAGEDEELNIRVRISIAETGNENNETECEQELENIGKQVLGIFRWLLILCLTGSAGG